MPKKQTRLLSRVLSATILTAFLLAFHLLPIAGGTDFVNKASGVGVASAACLPTQPAATLGKAVQTINAPTAGTYRVWSRIKAPDTSANSFYLQVDNGCTYNVGDAAGTPTNAWTWVNYQDGSSATPIDVTLAAGAHTLTYIGREANVQVDRVLILSDMACVPTGLGDNCTITDNMAPVVSIVAPTSGSTVQGTVTVKSSVYDISPIGKVEFYVDGTLRSTVQGGGVYEYSWDTKTVANGNHTLQVKAYDTASPVNVGTSSLVSVNVSNPPAVGQLELVSSLVVDKAELGPGETVSATATYKNNTVWPVTVKDIQLSARTPGTGVVQTTYFKADSTGPYTVAPGATIVFTGKHLVGASEPKGTYWAFAQYVDTANVTHTDSTETSFTVTTPDTTKPNVSITSPAAGAEILAGNTVQVDIAASDDIAVTKVEVAIDGVTKATLATAPYKYDWVTTPVAPGPHMITARAFDAAGNSTTTDLSVTIVAPPVTPTPTPSPTPTPPPAGEGTGLNATYYDRKGFRGTTFTRIDPQINFNWGTGEPAPGFGADTFSVRWTGYITVPTTGAYTFATTTDDGVRLWVNNIKLIGDWNNHAAKTNTAKRINLEAGKLYPIKMEYYEDRGLAVAKLFWSTTGSPQQVVPQSRLYTK